MSKKFYLSFILDLRDLFEKVGLGKYFSIFQEQEVRHEAILRFNLCTMPQHTVPLKAAYILSQKNVEAHLNFYDLTYRPH